MKLINNKFKTILLLCLIIFSNFIHSHQITNSNFKNQRKILKTNKKSKSNTNNDVLETTEFPESPLSGEEQFLIENKDSKYISDEDFKTDLVPNDNLKYLYFFFGMIECLPYMGPFVKLIEKIIKDAKYCSVSEMIQSYHHGTLESHNLPKTTFDNVKNMIDDMPWVPMINGEKIELDINNLNDSCKKLIKARNSMIEENKKYVDDFYIGFTSALDIKKSFDTKEEITIHKFIEESNNIIFGRNSGYRNLKKYLMLHFFTNLQTDEQLIRNVGSNWKDIIVQIITILRENGKMALQNIQSLQISQEENINCKKLNIQKMSQEYENANPTFIEKLSGGWSSIIYLKDCLAKGKKENQTSKVRKIIKIIAKVGLKKLIKFFLTKLAILIGFWFVKGIKIAFWGLRIINSIYKALQERKKDVVDKRKEFKYWGIATGSAIRLVHTIVVPIAKK